jgi:hypothetical protein
MMIHLLDPPPSKSRLPTPQKTMTTTMTTMTMTTTIQMIPARKRAPKRMLTSSLQLSNPLHPLPLPQSQFLPLRLHPLPPR